MDALAHQVVTRTPDQRAPPCDMYARFCEQTSRAILPSPVRAHLFPLAYELLALEADQFRLCAKDAAYWATHDATSLEDCLLRAAQRCLEHMPDASRRQLKNVVGFIGARMQIMYAMWAISRDVSALSPFGGRPTPMRRYRMRTPP